MIKIWKVYFGKKFVMATVGYLTTLLRYMS